MTDEKIKFLMRIDPDTDRKIKAAMPLANCRSQNEFVEKALQFYCDYAASQDCFSVLPAHARCGAPCDRTEQREPHLPPAVQTGGGDGHDDERPGCGYGDPGGAAERTAGAGASRR